jgi:hypothetical protein
MSDFSLDKQQKWSKKEQTAYKFFCYADIQILRPSPKRECSNLALEKKVWPPLLYNMIKFSYWRKVIKLDKRSRCGKIFSFNWEFFHSKKYWVVANVIKSHKYVVNLGFGPLDLKTFFYMMSYCDSKITV